MKKVVTHISHYVALCFFILISTFSFAGPSQSDQINPMLKAQLSEKISSQSEIYQKAEWTGNMYVLCISETAKAIQNNFSTYQSDMLFNIVNMTCQDTEDWFGIYNILLASYSMQKPISEQAAAVYLEKSYKSIGRSATNLEQRNKFYKAIGIIKN